MLGRISSYFTGGSQTVTVEETKDSNETEDKHARDFDSVIARASVVHEVDLDINYTKEVTVTREELAGVPSAFLLHNVLTPEECQIYIDESERLGYTDAPITTGAGPQMLKDVRDNLRVMWQASPRMMIPIWERVRDFFPQQLPEPALSEWKLVMDNALNERFRFYKYDTEQVFRPHYDGHFRRATGEKSHFTFIIYLNDGFKGGETTFFMGPGIYSKRKEADEVRVNPRQGTALVFRHTGKHSPLHEGSAHFSAGQYKYVLRSDIMYNSTQKWG